MALVRRFEDLAAWRAARDLTREVYRAAAHGSFGRDWGLADQIRRAAVSTMNNTAEGFDSGSRTELARFLRYAARSASEVQSCLYVALDQEYIDDVTFNSLYRHAQQVRTLVRALARTANYRRPLRAQTPLAREESAPYGEGEEDPWGRYQSGGSISHDA
jgi:four helix bundle protein